MYVCMYFRVVSLPDLLVAGDVRVGHAGTETESTVPWANLVKQ
jgi:hypothetical protein